MTLKRDSSFSVIARVLGNECGFSFEYFEINKIFLLELSRYSLGGEKRWKIGGKFCESSLMCV